MEFREGQSGSLEDRAKEFFRESLKLTWGHLQPSSSSMFFFLFLLCNLFKYVLGFFI